MAKGFGTPVASQRQPGGIVKAEEFSQRLKDCFSKLKDPRVARGQLHQLADIMIIGILAVIAGGVGWEDMEFYGATKQEWLSTFLALPNGIPSPDTFRRVFEALRPQELEACFQKWVKTLVNDLGVEVIAIDGKKLKGSYDRSSQNPALHLVSAWASSHRLVLAQTRVQDKSNEITAIPALLELLELTGCIVTLDAMGTQKTIATKINEAGADYILSLKANHPKLFAQVKSWFEISQAEDTLPIHSDHKVEGGHGRIENRKVWSIPIALIPDLYEADEWVGLRTIVIVERTRYLWNKTTHDVQYYLCSLPADSPRISAAIRQHWGIENSQHWVLDVTFGEDACRVRSLHGPQNLAILRRFALNALNREASCKRSLKKKIRLAAMDNHYMLKILASAFPDPSPET